MIIDQISDKLTITKSKCTTEIILLICFSITAGVLIFIQINDAMKTCLFGLNYGGMNIFCAHVMTYLYNQIVPEGMSPEFEKIFSFIIMNPRKTRYIGLLVMLFSILGYYS